uniref:M56 family metallopeptidase n=1 Tax=Alistipes communis TaxID=2585118 RepID=UPI003A876B46
MKELLIYALEVLVCSAALLLAYSVLLERRTAFLHCRLYLIGAMMLAALIPALSIPVWTGETLYMAADPVAAAAPTAAPAAADAGTPSLPVAVTLFLYALGVLLSFGAMIAQIVRIRRLRHGARTIRRADCDIVLTQADISSFSFFRTVYLHDAIPESDMAAVVAHELSHIRHRHSAERIVMECVKALLWWNPFVRIAARRLAEVEEYEADRDVLTQGYDPSEYIATIFKTQFGYSPDIANGLRDSLTKKRFQMMTKHSGDSRALLRLAGSIPVVLLLLACFSFTSQATEIRTDPPNGQNDSDIEIVSVGTIRKAPDTQERYRKAKGEADVYLVAEKMPLFEGKGTLRDFQHWVDARAAEYDHSGKVILTFIVEKNGSVAEVQVLDTPDPAMGEAAARIVASSPAWKAGAIDGEPVRVRYTLP